MFFRLMLFVVLSIHNLTAMEVVPTSQMLAQQQLIEIENIVNTTLKQKTEIVSAELSDLAQIGEKLANPQFPELPPIELIPELKKIEKLQNGVDLFNLAYKQELKLVKIKNALTINDTERITHISIALGNSIKICHEWNKELEAHYSSVGLSILNYAIDNAKGQIAAEINSSHAIISTRHYNEKLANATVETHNPHDVCLSLRGISSSEQRQAELWQKIKAIDDLLIANPTLQEEFCNVLIELKQSLASIIKDQNSKKTRLLKLQSDRIIYDQRQLLFAKIKKGTLVAGLIACFAITTYCLLAEKISFLFKIAQ